MLSDEINKIIPDENKLSKIKKAIITLERENIKTSEYNTADMVKSIKKLIESCVDN